MWKSSVCLNNNQLCPYSSNADWNFLRLDTCDRVTTPTKHKDQKWATGKLGLARLRKFLPN